MIILLAIVGAIGLFAATVVTIIRAIARFADRRRARRATRHLLGRSYWSGATSTPHTVSPRAPSMLAACALAAVLLAAWDVAFCAAVSADCGEERAAVKLGLDAEAAAVQLAPTDTTIAELIAQKRQAGTAHRAPAEQQTYRLRATVTAYKLEADQDFHIVISDAAGHHMIVEIPSPGCAAAGPWAKQIAAARAVAAQRLHPTPKLRRVAIPVVVTGVGFFDFLHGQVGVAPNGIELHPVLAIEFEGGGR